MRILLWLTKCHFLFIQLTWSPLCKHYGMEKQTNKQTNKTVLPTQPHIFHYGNFFFFYFAKICEICGFLAKILKFLKIKNIFHKNFCKIIWFVRNFCAFRVIFAIRKKKSQPTDRTYMGGPLAHKTLIFPLGLSWLIWNCTCICSLDFKNLTFSVPIFRRVV